MASPWVWPHRGRDHHHHEPSLESLENRITNLEEKMSAIDDLVSQFASAINTIALELRAEAANEDAAVAAKFQPFADRLTALASDPAGQQVPAAGGSAGSGTGDSGTGGSSTGTSSTGTDTTGGTSASADGGSASSTTAGAAPTDGSTGSTAATA